MVEQGIKNDQCDPTGLNEQLPQRKYFILNLCVVNGYFLTVVATCSLHCGNNFLRPMVHIGQFPSPYFSPASCIPVAWRHQYISTLGHCLLVTGLMLGFENVHLCLFTIK